MGSIALGIPHLLKSLHPARKVHNSRSSLSLPFSTIKSLREFLNSPTRMSGKTACVLLAQGAEEMEAVIAIDCLRRAGITVTVAGVDSNQVKCSREVLIVADKPLADVHDQPFDVIVLPGGLQGAKTLSADATVGRMLKDQETAGRVVAAICAAPMALATHGIGKGKSLTIYPSMENHLPGYKCKEDAVVVDGNIVTSRGPGTAFQFALTIIKMLLGEEKAKNVAKPMLVEF